MPYLGETLPQFNLLSCAIELRQGWVSQAMHKNNYESMCVCFLTIFVAVSAEVHCDLCSGVLLCCPGGFDILSGGRVGRG